MDDFERLINAAHQGLDKPTKELPPSPDLLDILSWTMIGLFIIGLLKKL